jgi:hypothetical protein
VNACCRFAEVMWYVTEQSVSGRTSRRQTSEELGERVGGNDRAVGIVRLFCWEGHVTSNSVIVAVAVTITGLM